MRTREGMAAAKAKGRLRGKKPKLKPRQEAQTGLFSPERPRPDQVDRSQATPSPLASFADHMITKTPRIVWLLGQPRVRNDGLNVSGGLTGVRTIRRGILCSGRTCLLQIGQRAGEVAAPVRVLGGPGRGPLAWPDDSEDDHSANQVAVVVVARR